jgi:hypothetical protein
MKVAIFFVLIACVSTLTRGASIGDRLVLQVNSGTGDYQQLPVSFFAAVTQKWSLSSLQCVKNKGIHVSGGAYSGNETLSLYYGSDGFIAGFELSSHVGQPQSPPWHNSTLGGGSKLLVQFRSAADICGQHAQLAAMRQDHERWLRSSSSGGGGDGPQFSLGDRIALPLFDEELPVNAAALGAAGWNGTMPCIANVGTVWTSPSSAKFSQASFALTTSAAAAGNAVNGLSVTVASPMSTPPFERASQLYQFQVFFRKHIDNVC